MKYFLKKHLDAIKYLLFLGTFFILGYSTTNYYASSLEYVPNIAFDWEHKYIPFLPILMLPYMSIDLFYVISFFIIQDKKLMKIHALRIFFVTAISLIFFVIWPLKISLTRPDVGGFNGILIDMLMGFDKPFNQAPSLHISQLLILWVIFDKYLKGFLKLFLNVWFLLIGISVVFTWQHHVMDVVTGAWLGVFILYLFPYKDNYELELSFSETSKAHKRLGFLYLIIASGLVFFANRWQGLAYALYYPALSYFMVGLGYLKIGPYIFKKIDGKKTLSSKIILLPFVLMARIFHIAFSWKLQSNNNKISNISLQPWPCNVEYDSCVLDLCAELERKNNYAHYMSVPMLDLVDPPIAVMQLATKELNNMVTTGKNVYIHCALGRGRSALTLASWLIAYKNKTAIDAMNLIKAVFPTTTFNYKAKSFLSHWEQLTKK